MNYQDELVEVIQDAFTAYTGIVPEEQDPLFNFCVNEIHTVHSQMSRTEAYDEAVRVLTNAMLDINVMLVALKLARTGRSLTL